MSRPRQAAPRIKRLSNFAKVLISVFLLLSLQRVIEMSQKVKELEIVGYKWLQAPLRLRSPRVGVVVIDISQLQTENGITPRSALRALRDTLASENVGAAAVAIDIDFSPEHNLFIDANDPAFFDETRRVRIPVLLGVSRTAGSGRAAWLGNASFASLAAAIVVPHNTGTVEKSRLPAPYPAYIPGLDVPDAAERCPCDDLPTLAVALASKARTDVAEKLLGHHPVRDFFTHGVEERRIGEGPGIPEFIVDYTNLGSLQANTVHAIWKDGTWTAREGWTSVKGKLVLVGDVDVESSGDRFPIPGMSTAVAGVLHHAAATTTLVKYPYPLRVFNEETRTLVDAFLTALVMALILPMKRHADRHRHASTPLRDYVLRPGAKSAAIAASSIVLAGILLVINILWFDWLFLTFGVMLHAWFEEPISRAIDMGV